ncbi:hypothetical protein ASG92_19210 [Arthrobacter sp. Soil736]|uniref:hypothetical protein n=1 Tax=Arthrobacter sp. Soil736 TaxID=1736395 RepID=UPI0006FFFC44|nr:hypothetical protein [Arthrobacter sp. Soil736]KRE64193.1 hypothetical protein ASG92_19210 [Arthrobacter sp. Soil736]
MQNQITQLVTGEPPVTTNAVRGEDHVPIPGGIEVLSSPLLVQLLVGSYVGLVSQGRVIARGWLDMVTADGGTVWVWLAGGGGRRIVHAGDGIGLLVLEEEI